uniref:NAD(P)(+)--arginine ADP-ribosyltransferase n=1 Tax=Sinocyclocheilus anshuiensis TaxID=1608454 RepID=A0A671T727_9TELE
MNKLTDVFVSADFHDQNLPITKTNLFSGNNVTGTVLCETTDKPDSHRCCIMKRQIFSLDMALNSVDDQYKGCREKMADLVETKYMKQEMSNPKSKFAIAWKLAEKKYKPPGDNLTKNHSIAIYVYTNSGFGVHKKFNEADHAIQILKKTQKKCYSTYRGTNLKFIQNVRNKKVSFGSFTSSSMNRNKTKFFGTVSCFEIKTCEGADLTKYSKLPHEEEVLIPPYEMFKVTAVKTRRGQTDLWCDTVYTLKNSGKRSDLNCIPLQ